jgi:hypothetical protein
MSAENSTPTSSRRSGSDIADLGSDPPRGRKRKRRGDICSTEEQEQGEKQQRRRLWQGEAATQTTMTNPIREGGRGRSSSHLQSQSPFANRPKLQPTPPSTLLSRSRSRSQSPVRISIRAMETGFHPVRLDLASASSSATGQPPTVVDRLVDVLVQDSGCAIPTKQQCSPTWTTCARLGAIPTSRYHRSWRGPSRTILGDSTLLGNSLTAPFTSCGRLPSRQLPRVLAQKT